MSHPFSYLAPRSKPELIRLLREDGARSRLLAGGTDLMVEMRFARQPPRYLIDLKKVTDFPGIDISVDGLSIGPGVSCAQVLESSAIREEYPLLATAASKLGSPQLRNRATPIGNLCTASPCADMGAAFLALGARVEIESHRGTRVVEVKDFFLNVKKTVVEPDEVVTRVIVGAEMAHASSGMEKLKRIKGHDLALASVAMVKYNGCLRISIGSCAPTPVVLPILPLDTPLAAILEEVDKLISPIDDVRASAEYRRFMVGVFIERLLKGVEPSVHTIGRAT